VQPSARVAKSFRSLPATGIQQQTINDDWSLYRRQPEKAPNIRFVSRQKLVKPIGCHVNLPSIDYKEKTIPPAISRLPPPI